MVDLAALQSEEGLEIIPGVRVRLRSLADYRQNPENPVSHTPRNLSTIVESIHKVGAARSGLAADGTIYAGNLTSEAMAIAGIEGIVEVTTDGTKWVMVNRPDLTPEQRKQAAHGDQWSAMLAGMDADRLLADLEAGINLDGIYSEIDFEAILGEALVEAETGEAPEPRLDKGAELAEHYGVKVGQIWTLGEHRLAVGDCTDKAVVEAVMRGEKVRAVVTDPPYGIEREGILNDDPEGLRGLYDGCLATMPVDNAVVVAFQSPRLFPVWLDAIRAAGHHFERMLWMYKPNDETYPWRGWLQTSEAILISSFGKGEWLEVHPYAHDCYSPTTLGQELSKDWGKVHASVKPLSVVQDLISRVAGLVYDPFAGSGTTLLGCENLKRKCRAIELVPPIVAVCIQRLADMGLEPKLLP